MPLPLFCQEAVKESCKSTFGCLGKPSGGSDWFMDFDNTASLTGWQSLGSDTSDRAVAEVSITSEHT